MFADPPPSNPLASQNRCGRSPPDAGPRWLHDQAELELVAELTRNGGDSFETAEDWLCDIGWAFYWEEQFDRAIAYFSEALRFNPRCAQALHGRGRAHHRNGNDDWAIADYSEGVRLDPQHANLFLDRGILNSSYGRHDRAIADYGEAIKLNPIYADAFFERAAAYKEVKTMAARLRTTAR